MKMKLFALLLLLLIVLVLTEARKRNKGMQKGGEKGNVKVSDKQSEDKRVGRALKRKFRKARRACRKKDSKVPCPVCGSNRKIYWKGPCGLVNESCANEAADQIYMVKKAVCLKRAEIPPNPDPMTGDVCVEINNRNETKRSCEWGKAVCVPGVQYIPIIHQGKCGNCNIKNVCPSKDTTVKGKGKRSRWRRRKRCILANGIYYNSMCDFYVARCMRYKEDGTILKPGRCKVDKGLRKKFRGVRRICKKDPKVPCPVCGSDREFYWKGKCELVKSSCGNQKADQIYVVRARYCIFKWLKLPKNRGNSCEEDEKNCGITPRKGENTSTTTVRPPEEKVKPPEEKVKPPEEKVKPQPAEKVKPPPSLLG